MSVAVVLNEILVELGGAPVLKGISLEIEPGEFITLLGPSGSGKTTTLNVVAGSIRQQSGSVRFDGHVVDRVPMHERGIGIVFQSYALFPHLNVGENVAYALAVRKVPRSERKRMVERMLELVRLPGYESRSVLGLSGGQQQRVALARALVFDPQVLLLDEPLAALDRQLREVMQVELRRIHDDIGVTTIGVTHDQMEAMTTADRIAIMNEGRIEQLGTPEDVYRRPATLFVAQFLGEANLIPVDASGYLAGIGARVKAAPGGVAVIRPEDTTVCAPDDATSLARAHVETVNYQGFRYRLAVRLASGERLIAMLRPNGAAPPTTGAEVGIVLPVDDIHTIDAAGEVSIAVEEATA